MPSELKAKAQIDKLDLLESRNKIITLTLYLSLNDTLIKETKIIQ